MLPLWRLMPAGTKLMYTAPTEGFMLMMKIGALAGLFVALPFIIFQLWLFIAPGLYSNEKRFAVPFVLLEPMAPFLTSAPALRYQGLPAPAAARGK